MPCIIRDSLSDTKEEDENYIEKCDPIQIDKCSYDSDLVLNYVESGYMECNSWKFSNSAHCSNETLWYENPRILFYIDLYKFK